MRIATLLFLITLVGCRVEKPYDDDRNRDRDRDDNRGSRLEEEAHGALIRLAHRAAETAHKIAVQKRRGDLREPEDIKSFIADDMQGAGDTAFSPIDDLNRHRSSADDWEQIERGYRRVR